MNSSPTPAEVQQALAELDPRELKIVGGMLAVMIREPKRVRDREWMAEQITHLTLLAGDFEADSGPDAVAAVEGYLHEKATRLLHCSLLLFQRVGLDMAPRTQSGFSFEEAMQQGLSYFQPPPESERPS